MLCSSTTTVAAADNVQQLRYQEDTKTRCLWRWMVGDGGVFELDGDAKRYFACEARGIDIKIVKLFSWKLQINHWQISDF